MKPAQLTARNFKSYPTEGRETATRYLDLLRQTPISILPTLLRDLAAYDWKFPAEQAEIVQRLTILEAHPLLLQSLASITVPDSMLDMPWAERPQEFLDSLTAYLWSSRQMDAYRVAADKFVAGIRAMTPVTTVPMPRLVMVMIGRDAPPSAYPLFQKLRPHGQTYVNVDAEGAGEALLSELARRAAGLPTPYAHWYLDGGSPRTHSLPQVATQLFYPDLAPIRRKVLDQMLAAIQAGSGPEGLRARFDCLTPRDLSAGEVTSDTRMQHLMVSLLTDGSGTQIFSTSFVQWAAREILRRAQPQTMLVRFAPRQRQLSFNQMVMAARETVATDPEGSLVDADMAAYYTFLEMKKLPGAEQARLLVWLEGRQMALLSGPGIPPETTNKRSVPMKDLLEALRLSSDETIEK